MDDAAAVLAKKTSRGTANSERTAKLVLVLRKVAGANVSIDAIRRVTGDVGRELAERRDADPKSDEALAKRPEAPPALAVVECDGGRIRTREPGHGRGVHLPGEGWRETQGDVGQVLDELRAWQTKLGEPPPKTPDTDPRQIVATTIGCLENDRRRMKYPECRRAGLPIATAWMESLVKEVNYRVKGTEMFGNDPQGAEAILQVRAAALSDDDRLSIHRAHRPGSPFTRRPNPPTFHAQTRKS